VRLDSLEEYNTNPKSHIMIEMNPMNGRMDFFHKD